MEKFSSLPAKNEIVLAKFEDKWYRAKVIDAKNKSKIKVFFIDYGNFDENCSLDNVLKINFNDINSSVLTIQPLAYCIKLNGVSVDLEKNADLLAQMLEVENFLVKCISVKTEDDENVYNVEIYNGEICFNKLFDENYGEDTHSIDHSNYEKLVVDKTRTLDVEYLNVDEFEKPISLILNEDIAFFEKFSANLNSYYENNNEEAISNENDLQVGMYYALKQECNWYRMKLTNIDYKTKNFDYELIDFGCEDHNISYYQNNEYLIKKLNKKFWKQYRFAFKVQLVSTNDFKKKLEFKNKDKICQLLEDYFFDSVTENKKKPLKIRIYSRAEDGCDFIYNAEIFNLKNQSLNKQIEAENEALSNPIVVEKFNKLVLKNMPKQQFDSKQHVYHLFVQRIECFYAFDENSVINIQEHVQETCKSILSSNFAFNFKSNTGANMPEVGNLLFAKYDDDMFWYRCLVTNTSKNFDKFELFFLDFGNTEVVDVKDILLPFNEKHVECFLKYPPQAFKSKLYGLLKASDAGNEAFKNFVMGKEFQIKLIKKYLDNNSVIYTHEVQLMQVKTKLDVHSHLIENNHAKFDSFEVILKNVKTSEEIEFYQERFNIQKEKLGLA